MPFGDADNLEEQKYWTNHFENFLKKFLETKFPELDIRRSEPLGVSILDRILVDVTQSDILIADITGFNPNVLWELGVRHSFRHGTVIIADKKNKLPFNLKDIGTLIYDFSLHPSSSEFNEFFEKLEKSVRDCLENKTRKDSPVLESIPRGAFFEIIKKQENLRKINAVILECDDNLKILKNAFTRAKLNQSYKQKKMEDKSSVIISRLRFSALELLVVNQYLSEDLEFNKHSTLCLRTLIKTNDQLVAWDYDTTDVTEEWLIKYLPVFVKRLNKLKSNLVILKKKLLNQN